VKLLFETFLLACCEPSLIYIQTPLMFVNADLQAQTTRQFGNTLKTTG
jgi:hypothetical protein